MALRVLAPGQGLVLPEAVGGLVRRVGLAWAGLGDRERNRCVAAEALSLRDEQAAQGRELSRVQGCG
jgi:hypothetical protein